MRHLPPLRYPGARAEPDGYLWQVGVAGRRTHRRGRRKLHPRIHPESGREDRLRIQAHHADLPGPGLGRELDGAGGLHKVADSTRTEDNGERSTSRFRYVERAVRFWDPEDLTWLPLYRPSSARTT